MDNYYSGGRRRQGSGDKSLYENVPNQRVSESSVNKLKGFQRTDHRVSQSLASTGQLTETLNPYSLYNSVDNDSLDDGIHMDLATGEGLDDTTASSDQPSEAVILREFADYMDVMSPMSEPEYVALQNTSTPEKWTLLVNQKNRSPVFNVRYYIENLRQNQGTRRRRFSIGKATKSGGLGYVLHKLKLDLKMSPKSFLHDFIKEPNSGLHLLVQILKELQRDKNILNTARKTKKDELLKSLEEEEDCLLCLRFLLRVEAGIKKMAAEDGIYDLVAQTLLSTMARCRSIGLKILAILCNSTTSGFHNVLEAMERQKQKINDDVLFRTLCNSINAKDQAYQPFMTSAVRFFNTLILSTSNASGRVHLQHELEMAGFHPDQLETLTRGDTFEQEELARELDIWKSNFIDVTTMKDENTTLESRNKMLRDEISRMEEQIKMLEKTLVHRNKEKKKTEEKSEDYRERAAELQDTLEKLRKMYEENTGRVVGQVDLNMEEVLKPLDVPSDSRAGNFSSVRSISTVSDDVPDAPPLPPAAPPLPSQSRKTFPSSKVELPLLNWTPLQKVQNTIFQDIDDAVYRELNVTDFESQFKLQRPPVTSSTRERRQKITQKQSTRLLFVDLNRAKNISITKHRTGLTSRETKDAIELCDVRKLPGEYAELLIKFIPTKEEIKKLSKQKDDYWRMGEAEQFLFQLAQVERLESKLSVLAFMGIFNELVNSVKPNINKVLQASNAVLSSHGLRKVFEIILAFGNFMNGSKRGYVMGFRLESLNKLTDVKSVDKQVTLMHYLVEHVQRNYPEFLTFYEDFSYNIDKSASYHAMGQDVVWLRKGIDLVKFEKEKQEVNHSLETFYLSGSVQVAEIAENFKKMEEAYRDVCGAMGENYKLVEPSTFFGILADFFEKFKNAHRDILKRSTQRLAPVPSKPPVKPSEPSKPSEPPKVKKTQAPAPPERKNEPPKIRSPITPVAISKARNTTQQQNEARGPVAGQHNVLKPSETNKQPHVTTKVKEKSQEIRKKRAPAPSPQHLRDTVTDHGHSFKYPAVKKQHVKKEQSPATPAKIKPEVNTNGHTEKVMNGSGRRSPVTEQVDPQRDRSESEAFRAEVTDALAELDEAVELEEKRADYLEEENVCSRL